MERQGKKERIGVCSECRNKPRSLKQYHPKTGEPICSTCYRRLTGEFGICPECRKGPKWLLHLHPEKRNHICKTCYRRLTNQFDICPQCREGPKVLFCFDRKTREFICRNCFRKQKRKEWFLNLPFEEAANLILEVANSTNQKKSGWNGHLMRLQVLINSSPEKYMQIRDGIYRSYCPAAIKIMKEFERTKEGGRLQELAKEQIEEKRGIKEK